MTSTLSPHTGSLSHPATGPAVSPRPGFWRAPVTAATYREVGYVLTSLPVAVAGFVFAVTMFSVGVSLAFTVAGLPVLVAALAGARGLAVAERARARHGLGLAVAGPGAVGVPAGSGWWETVRRRIADPAGWRALLFQVVMFPARVASFSITVTFVVTSWVVAAFPLYSWVFARYTDWPGYQVYDFTTNGVRHAYYVESPVQVAAVAVIGMALVLITPKIVRGLTNIDRAAVRTLLG